MTPTPDQIRKALEVVDFCDQIRCDNIEEAGISSSGIIAAAYRDLRARLRAAVTGNIDTDMLIAIATELAP